MPTMGKVSVPPDPDSREARQSVRRTGPWSPKAPPPYMAQELFPNITSMGPHPAAQKGTYVWRHGFCLAKEAWR